MFNPRTLLIIVLLISMAAPASTATIQPSSFTRLDRDLSIADPSLIATGDFNNDGNLDLVFTDKGISQVFVLLGNGNGTFGPEASFATLGPPVSLVTGEFNNDGNLDLAMAISSRNSIVVLFGAGDGSFSLPTELQAGPSPFEAPLGVVAGDFDLDGTQDLMSIAVGSNVVSFIKSNGNGTFGPYAFAGVVRDDPLMIIQADFNLDGKLDIATANFDFFGITVALGTGTGTLQNPFEIATTTAGAIALTSGDFNQDTFPDLAFLYPFAFPGSGFLPIALGNGDGTFGPLMPFLAGTDSRVLLSGDFNLDGDLDLVFSNFVTHTITIKLGTQGVLQLGPSQDFSFFDLRPIPLATGDFNNDCKPDLAVLTLTNGALLILLNTTPKAPLDIGGVELSTNVLWPPNHQMVDVTVGYTVTNNCGPLTCTLSVASNEPVNGRGDGNSAPDWEIIDEHHLRLRAERAGNGPGRVYTITITCSDTSGSSATRTVTVTVPRVTPR